AAAASRARASRPTAPWCTAASSPASRCACTWCAPTTWRRACSTSRATCWRAEGTLATAPLLDGAPRRLRDDVMAADFEADGESLVTASLAGSKVQVE